MKKRKTGLFLMITGALIVFCGIGMTAGIPDRIEYIIRAPETSQEMPVSGRLEEIGSILDGMEWTTALKSVNGIAQSEYKEKTRVTVYAIPDGYFGLRHMTLCIGRLISREDVKERLSHAVITKRTAEEFFLSEDPIGQTLTCNDLKLKVIGVVDDNTWIGESNKNVVFAPISLTDTPMMNAETMEIQVKTSSKAEKTIAGNLLKIWSPNGTLYDHTRQKMNVWMSIWFPAVIFGLFFLLKTGKIIYQREKKVFQEIKEKLKTKYISECWPFCLRHLIDGIVKVAFWIGFVWLLIYIAVKPMYIYTDWIPEAFVDPKAIQTTGTNILLNSSASVVYRSRETVLFDLALSISRFGSMTLLLGMIIFLFCYYSKSKSLNDNEENVL